MDTILVDMYVVLYRDVVMACFKTHGEANAYVLLKGWDNGVSVARRSITIA